MKISILTLLLGLSFFSVSQSVHYQDVAVIVNDNSQTSIDIGNYFQNARNIPNQNMIHVSAPTVEEIDSAEFELIRVQIQDYLLNNNLADSINYLVTTKGLPLKIDANCFDSIAGGISCASFDSELCLILSPNANEIGQSGSSPNPIFNQIQHFSREAAGIFLVTRLTGYTKQDIYNLIDRSGFETGFNQANAQTVLDLNSATGGDSSFFHDNFITPANDYLVANSWNSQVDLNFDPLLNQNNVFAYAYYGQGPISNVSLNYNWTQGSIGIMATGETATTFDSAQNTTGKFLLGDLISEGCTGGLGYVNSLFFSQLFRSDILFDRYLDLADDYNLAESFYMAASRLSWQTVVVGDPKASVRIDNTAGFDDPEELNLRMYPNPTHGNLTIHSGEMISSVQIFSVNGALVKSIDTGSKTKVDLDLQELDGGVYLAHIFSGDKMTLERIVLVK
jgi:uncharacterized protein (TIGR03790 family)